MSVVGFSQSVSHDLCYCAYKVIFNQIVSAFYDVVRDDDDHRNKKGSFFWSILD